MPPISTNVITIYPEAKGTLGPVYAERMAAKLAVDSCINNNTKIIGFGGGSGSAQALRRLAERIVTEDDLFDVICVPVTFELRQLARKLKLNCSTLNRHPSVDISFDTIDEADQNLTVLQGSCACITQKKVLAANSKRVVFVADYTKKSICLGEQWCKGIAIEVIPLAWVPVQARIKALLGGELRERMAANKLGPLKTDNNCFVLDWFFHPDSNCDWWEVCKTVKMIPGVMEIGILTGRAVTVYFGMADGTVIVKNMKKHNIN